MNRTASPLWSLIAFCAALTLTLAFPGSAAVATTQAATPIDPVAALAQDLKAGAPPLTAAPSPLGYVPDLLRRLKIAEDSQVLVFSRTSFQGAFIGPSSPRAIYFTDTVSLAYAPDAPLIELWAVGRDGRIRFYTLNNLQPAEVPREDPRCNFCHAGARPAAPGPMTLSVATVASGEVIQFGPLTDARTPIANRWGGWYVTGDHGTMRHRGNVPSDTAGPAVIDAAQNLSSLKGRFNLARYSRETSDIVALLTLEHEFGFLNLAADIQALATIDYDPADMDKAVDALADYMLGVGQAALTAPVKGSSGFTQRFAGEGPKDAQGRSLRDFDLQTRLFRYPLSFMIHTPAFDGLPVQPKAALYRRLADVLTGRDTSPKYQTLPPAGRLAALEILTATKNGLPASWRNDAVALNAAR